MPYVVLVVLRCVTGSLQECQSGVSPVYRHHRVRQSMRYEDWLGAVLGQQRRQFLRVGHSRAESRETGERLSLRQSAPVGHPAALRKAHQNGLGRPHIEVTEHLFKKAGQ